MCSCYIRAIVGFHKRIYPYDASFFILHLQQHHWTLHNFRRTYSRAHNRNCMRSPVLTHRRQLLRYKNYSCFSPFWGEFQTSPLTSSLLHTTSAGETTLRPLQRSKFTADKINPQNLTSCGYKFVSSFNKRSRDSHCTREYYHTSNDTRYNTRTMKLSPKTAASIALIVTAVTVLSFQNPIPTSHAERYRLFSSSSQHRREKADVIVNSDTTSPLETDKDIQNAKQWVETSTARKSAQSKTDKEPKCPFYGCPLRPVDVHYNTAEYKEAFTIMRNDKRTVVQHTDAAVNILSSSANDQHATFTLIGYKGGNLQEQINQDRAIIVASYKVVDDYISNSSKNSTSSTLNGKVHDAEISTAQQLPQQLQKFIQSDRILLGVFDGHAPLGEQVSEYVAVELPKLLASKISKKAHQIVESKNDKSSSSTLTEQEIVQLTKSALTETFIELDRTAPAHPSGGCTASIILKQGQKVYVANTGDSRSFVAIYRPSTKNVTISYISREDKPCLPDERARVIARGGQVYIPTHGTSRVVFHDPTTGAPTGLAMSRSIGDWEAGKMGVIPDPIVDVLDIHNVVANALLDDLDDEYDADSYQVNSMLHAVNGAEDDVYIFAVSATDGMMDYITAIDIARVLAHSLFDDSGAHPVTALEHLIFAAANAWQEAKQGRYRDDIAIAVSVLRQPQQSQAKNNDHNTAVIDPDGNLHSN
jgi:serine/threonine protein phosphatase PrpC